MVEQSLLPKFPSYVECGRCQHVMKQIASVYIEIVKMQSEPNSRITLITKEL